MADPATFDAAMDAMLERAELLIVIVTRRRDYMRARVDVEIRGEESRLHFNRLNDLIAMAHKLVHIGVTDPGSLPMRDEIDLLVPPLGDLIAPPRDA